MLVQVLHRQKDSVCADKGGVKKQRNKVVGELLLPHPLQLPAVHEPCAPPPVSHAQAAAIPAGRAFPQVGS